MKTPQNFDDGGEWIESKVYNNVPDKNPRDPTARMAFGILFLIVVLALLGPLLMRACR